MSQLDDLPETPIVIRATPRMLTECPSCHRKIGPTPADDVICHRRRQRHA